MKVLLLAILAYFLSFGSSQSVTPINVYFSNSLNNNSSVVAVTRYSPTSAVATYALQELIAGPLPAERQQGAFSEWNGLFVAPSQCGGADFTVSPNHKGPTPENGTWTVKFCRAISSPGVGVDARVTTEIDRTLLQFSSIKKVVILTVTGHCFGDESGTDQCLK
jgi:hypothetical protein